MVRRPRGSQKPMGAWAPISSSKDIFMADDAGLADVKAVPWKALLEQETNHANGLL